MRSIESTGEHTQQSAGILTSNIFVVAVVLLITGLPVFLTPVVPLVDHYNHIARIFILSGTADSDNLLANYESAWKLLPNIGFDVLGVGLMQFLDPFVTARVFALMMIWGPLTGTLYLAYVLQRKVSWLSASLAGIMAHNAVLIWGFSNFLLGLGLSLFGLAVWISLRHAPRLQYTAGMVFAVLILLCHGFAFMLWGLCLAAIELGVMRQAGDLRFSKLLRRALQLLGLAVLPFLMFLSMSTSSSEKGASLWAVNFSKYVDAGTHWQRLWQEIVFRLDATLRVADSTLPQFDMVSGIVFWGALLALLFAGVIRPDSRMAFVLLLSGLLIVVTPPNLFSSSHLPERIPVLFFALIASAVSVSHERFRKVVTGLFLVIFAVRMTVSAAAWYQDGREYKHYLDVLPTLEQGNLGAVYLANDKTWRSFSPNCAPLIHLMAVRQGIAVDLFANETQQPIRLSGDLKVAQDLISARSHDSNKSRTFEAFANAGFDTVLACGREDAAMVGNYKVVAIGDDWTILKLAQQ